MEPSVVGGAPCRDAGRPALRFSLILLAAIGILLFVAAAATALFVAVGSGTTSPQFSWAAYGASIATSPDGSTWTQQCPAPGAGSGCTTLPNEMLNGVAGGTDALGNDLWVAVGEGGQTTGGPGTILTSPDGSNWSRSCPANPSWTPPGTGTGCPTVGDARLYDVAFGQVGGAPGWVAVGEGSLVMTSPDGINWSTPPLPPSYYCNFQGVDYDATTGWVVVGKFGCGVPLIGTIIGQDAVLTSPDGITWTAVPQLDGVAGQGPDWNAVASGPGLWVAAGLGVGGTSIGISPNGQQFTPVPSHGSFSGVASGGGKWVAVSGDEESRIWTSQTGADWVPGSPTALGAEGLPYLGDVAYGGGTWAAVGEYNGPYCGPGSAWPNSLVWPYTNALQSNVMSSGDGVIWSTHLVGCLNFRGVGWHETTPPVPPLLCPLAGAPPNDCFVNATPVGVNTFSGTGTNVAATLELGEPIPCCSAANSVWWDWTPTVTGNAVVQTCGSAIDTVLTVYKGSAINALTPVASNDNHDIPSCMLGSLVSFPCVAGTTYHVQVMGALGALVPVVPQGDLLVNMECVPLPPGVPPLAAFVPALPGCGPMQPVQFTDMSTPGAFPIMSWWWDFGDGDTSTLQNPSHLYAAPGVYAVVETVSAADGLSDSIAKPVEVKQDDCPHGTQESEEHGFGNRPPRDGRDDGLASGDSDGDGVSDGADDCVRVANPGQADLDGDALGDACDPDMDADGVRNEADTCPRMANKGQADLDHDGIGDACDDDRDGDGMRNTLDNCADSVNKDQADVDGDRVGDACQAKAAEKAATKVVRTDAARDVKGLSLPKKVLASNSMAGAGLPGLLLVATLLIIIAVVRLRGAKKA